MTKIIYLTFLFLILSNNVFSQSIEITGQVIDKENNDPIIEANIFLLHSNIGTISDSLGFFTLFYESKNLYDTLVINYSGYNEYQIALQNFKKKSIIYLNPKILKLDKSITVIGERINLAKQEIPHAKYVVNKDEIEQMGSSEISDLFKTISSARIEGNDLDGRNVQIRGSNADEINVYVDGVLINNLRYDNKADLTLIPTESIENLEILKGANLLLLGNGSFGGVVNITTKNILNEKYFVKFKAGSFNTNYFIADIDIPLSDHFSINYFGQLGISRPKIEYFSSELYKPKTENNSITSSKQNHHLKVNYLTKAGQLNSHLMSYFFNYKKDLWKNTHDNYIASLGYKGKLFKIDDLDLNINYLSGFDKIIRKPSESTKYNSNYNSTRLNLLLAKKFSFSTFSLQFLSEYNHDELINTSKITNSRVSKTIYRASIYENRASLASVFSFNDTLKNNSNLTWKTYLGSRAEFLANGSKDVLLTFGVESKIKSDNLVIIPYANYGKNVKYPTLFENAFIRDLTDFYRTDSTETRLKPEYSNSAEMGINLTYFPSHLYYKKLTAELAVFGSIYYNKLLNRPFDNLISESLIGRHNIKGIEGSLIFNEVLNKFKISNSFTILDISDAYLSAYKPEVSYNIQLEYFFFQYFYLNLIYFYEGKSTAWFYDINNQFQIEYVAPFFDFDLSLGYKFSYQNMLIHMQISGYNVFDQSGYRNYTLKKRYLQFALSLEY